MPRRSTGGSTTTTAPSNTEEAKALINRRVSKKFSSKLYHGTITKYVAKHRIWGIDYDDGDDEEMEYDELSKCLELYDDNKTHGAKKKDEGKQKGGSISVKMKETPNKKDVSPTPTTKSSGTKSSTAASSSTKKGGANSKSKGTNPGDSCPEIGPGWTFQLVQRGGSNKKDRHWYSPTGTKFRSKPEVERYLAGEKSKDNKFGGSVTKSEKQQPSAVKKETSAKKKKKQKLEVKEEETPKQSPVNNNKKEKVAAAATKQGEDASWECHKCTLINAPGRSRCEGCRSWKGGQRQGFSPSSQQGSSSVKKKKSSNENSGRQGGGSKKADSVVKKSPAKVAAASKESTKPTETSSAKTSTAAATTIAKKEKDKSKGKEPVDTSHVKNKSKRASPKQSATKFKKQAGKDEDVKEEKDKSKPEQPGATKKRQKSEQAEGSVKKRQKVEEAVKEEVKKSPINKKGKVVVENVTTSSDATTTTTTTTAMEVEDETKDPEKDKDANTHTASAAETTAATTTTSSVEDTPMIDPSQRKFGKVKKEISVDEKIFKLNPCRIDGSVQHPPDAYPNHTKGKGSFGFLIQRLSDRNYAMRALCLHGYGAQYNTYKKSDVTYISVVWYPPSNLNEHVNDTTIVDGCHLNLVHPENGRTYLTCPNLDKAIVNGNAVSGTRGVECLFLNGAQSNPGSTISADDIASCITKCKDTLLCLAMTECKINVHLLTTIASCKKLRGLTLENCQLCDGETTRPNDAMLANVLRSCPDLRWVFVKTSIFGTECWNVLAEGMAGTNCPNLEVLWVDSPMHTLDRTHITRGDHDTIRRVLNQRSGGGSLELCMINPDENCMSRYIPNSTNSTDDRLNGVERSEEGKRLAQLQMKQHLGDNYLNTV